jgi:hypothetical protein
MSRRAAKDANESTGNLAGGVTIGDVGGDIERATIAGRDVVETTIDQLVYNVFEEAALFQEQRDRVDVLALMKEIWITHVLEQSLSAGASSGARLEVRPDAISSPWATVIDTSDQVRKFLPAGTSVVDLFHEMQGSLLLLGEPGAGKSTALLELVRQAIAWAEQDPAQPIPVVLDLGWWTDRRRRLSDWLLDVLQARYCIRAEVAGDWLQGDELGLYLDGLDRVEPRKRREWCVQAINDFRQEHGLMPIVVCCRTAAYESLETRLQLQGAICLHKTESLEHQPG